RLRPDLARRVPLSGQVFGDQDVAGPEALHGAVADLDVDRAREREHGVAPRRVVPGIRARRLESPDHDPGARDQLGGLGLIAARLELRVELFEVRLPVRARIDADDGHGNLPFSFA